MIKQMKHVEELARSESIVLKDAALRIYSALEILENSQTPRTSHERSRQNDTLFGDVQGHKYRNSLLNPDYVKTLLPDNPADVISALMPTFQSARRDAILGNKRVVSQKADLLIDLSKELGRKIIDRETVISKWRSYWLDTIYERTDSDVKSLVVTGKDNVFEQVLLSANDRIFHGYMITGILLTVKSWS